MKKSKYQITDDGFGIHTFELTKLGVSSDEINRIVANAKSKYTNRKTGNIWIYPSRKGVRIYLNRVNPNLYNIKVIVTAKKLIDENAIATSILNMHDDFELLHELVDASLMECLGEKYTLNCMCLSRVDVCVNVMLSETFSAERYVKLIKKSMIGINNDNIETFVDSEEKNKHSFRVKTGEFTFTAYDKYFQLEDIDEDYTKESEGLLRMEIAIDRGILRREKKAYKLSNKKVLVMCTVHSREIFQKYIENHFFDGDYYSAEGIRRAINLSEYSKSQKERMLSYIDMQLYKRSFNAILDELIEKNWTEYRLMNLIGKFERINIYPISMACRDQHGDMWVPGLKRILDI